MTLPLSPLVAFVGVCSQTLHRAEVHEAAARGQGLWSHTPTQALRHLAAARQQVPALQHAQTLCNQDEPNIDDLLTIVTESVNAYKVCKQRIDAVEAALKTALDGAGVDEAPEPPAPAPGGSARSRARPARAAVTPPAPPAVPGFDDMDQDIPF